MGIDYTTYIGPYVEVHNPPIPAKETVRTCSNNKCSQHKQYQSGKFCSTCGAEIKDREFDSLAPIHVDCGEFDEKLVPIQTEYKFDDETDIWVDNLKGRAGISQDSQSTYTKEVTPEQINFEMTRLETARAKEIAGLRQIFGDTAVVVKWGIVAYAH